jgi:hypothetical protein
VHQSLNFFPAPSVMVVIILTRSSRNFPTVAPTSQEVLESHSLDFLLLYPNTILDPHIIHFLTNESNNSLHMHLTYLILLDLHETLEIAGP